KFEEGGVINVGDIFVIISIDSEDGGEDKVEEVEKTVERDDSPEEEETAGVVGDIIASSEEIPASTEGQIPVSKPGKRKKVLATPVARKLAKDLNVDINMVEGTGPNGRVMKEDIRQFKNNISGEKPVKYDVDIADEKDEQDGKIERIPLTRIRKTIAEQMSNSRFTIPHTTAMDELNVSNLYEFRKKYKNVLRDEGINITYLPFIIKAVIIALKEYPEFNSFL